MISAAERCPKHHITVNGLQMAYVEEGAGNPIVFLHGNPSSSYQWRNVIPHLTGLGKCIAPDLIGMGASDKLPNSGPGSYRFIEHREYLDAFLDALGLHDKVTLVLHDWGSTLGFDWACRHPDQIRGIAYMEAFVAPISSWDDWPEQAIATFQALRSDAGEKMVLQDNFFIERVLPTETLRRLTEAEMAVYRRPYLEPGESRRPTLTWAREIPIGGEPADVHNIITRYATWLATADIPKLFIEANPGAMFPSHRDIAKSWPDQTHLTVPGGHFLIEDDPVTIGTTIATWLNQMP
ncbi:haloalkane dehalogenase [Actinoplanes teichomyceticus]|uniref:Haloalkane dehalogenase n=1 Tax=Actinoplanes teichomyceticus TaxID=1867 RepID=A0A561VKT9_ACTTI|nr:haloalkane dehalogenase [Actinoplanes teichomyceticus]TWG12197.1 haloalkane dehalogenase [Actinoplanes teichomyceticus]GIF14130.1 haloalkane dehalogenase [Actinoplanes teichomyceticus]